MRFLQILPFFVLPLTAQETAVPLALPGGPTVDPDQVVLQVGEIKITAKQLDAMIDLYPANAQVYYRGPGKQQFADTLVRTLVVAAEGRKRKLNETEKFKEQQKFNEATLIAQALGQQLTQELKLDDAILHGFFEAHRCEYQSWHPRQILVRVTGSPMPLRPGQKDLTDEEALARAQEIRKRLAGGADFAELARSESDDANSGANGGDLGQVRHGQVVPTLEEAICKMNAGETGDPVRTPFGYHVVKLDSKEAKNFDEVKAELEQRARPETAKKLIDEWIAKTKVVKDPAYYAPDQPGNIAAPPPKKP